MPSFAAVAEGATSDEAVSNLREQLNKEIESAKRLVMLEVPAKEENPWLAIAGSLKDNPLLDDWKAAMEEYRRQRDIEDGIERITQRSEGPEGRQEIAPTVRSG